MAKSSVEEPGLQAFNDSARKDNASLAMTTTILQERRPRQFGIGLRRHVTPKIKASDLAKTGVFMGHARANGLRLSMFLFHCRPGDPEGDILSRFGSSGTGLKSVVERRGKCPSRPVSGRLDVNHSSSEGGQVSQAAPSFSLILKRPLHARRQASPLL